jgi:hypothetical protein
MIANEVARRVTGRTVGFIAMLGCWLAAGRIPNDQSMSQAVRARHLDCVSLRIRKANWLSMQKVGK